MIEKRIATMYQVDGKMMQMEDGSGLDTFTMTSNKARKPNWTEGEVMTLLEEYSKRKHMLKAKVGVAVSMTARQHCWGEIADVINATQGMMGCYRQVKEVQKKFENLSNRMRTEFATAKGYRLIKQERSDDEDYFGKDDDSHASEEQMEEEHSAKEIMVPVLNIPFKANNRVQKNLDNCVPTAPRSNQIFSSISNQSSPTLPNSESNYLKPSKQEEMAYPSGESVCVNAKVAARSHSFTEERGNDSIAIDGENKPTPETSAKLREVMLKRVNSAGSTSNSDALNKKLKMGPICQCLKISNKTVAKLNKQVLILKKQNLKQKLEKQELEKEKVRLEKEKVRLENEKLRLENEKLKLEIEAVKITRDNAKKQELETEKLRLVNEKLKLEIEAIKISKNNALMEPLASKSKDSDSNVTCATGLD